MAADQAKSDFISSISHELRSPLHGILASVEFLQDTGVDLFQNSMIDTIERCGRTLLDTIQHVLDFAKINNFTKPKRNTRKDERSSDEKPYARKTGLSVDIDISVITEDVVDTVYAGYEFHGNSSLGWPTKQVVSLPKVSGEAGSTIVTQFQISLKINLQVNLH
jgi:signal transduction histidine kinase